MGNEWLCIFLRNDQKLVGRCQSDGKISTVFLFSDDMLAENWEVL